MKVVPSLAEQTIGGRGYTDKQAKLARELVIKYERQLFKLGVDISPVLAPEYRLPLRSIDRTTCVWVEDDLIRLQFPYDVDRIDQVRNAGKISQGRIQFNRERRVQELALTEWNLNWAYAFAQQHQFEIDATVQELMDLIVQVEQTPYVIELQYNRGQIEIVNAPDSLTEYINTNLGGLNADNLFRLIDLAPVLGYSVSKSIADTVIEEFGTRFYSLCANRELKVDSPTSTNLVQAIVAYARATDRFPIFVYEPDLSNRLFEEFNRCLPGEMTVLTESTTSFDAKVLYTTRIPKNLITQIPLMISSAGMLYGGDRQLWIQTAEKVVYFSKEVYNKNTKGPTVCRLD
jgi:hypothetical protein